VPACRDGVDNEMDGAIDFPGDLGCASADDVSEWSASLGGVDGQSQCFDGEDNDGDSLVDFPLDRGCANAMDMFELPDCADGMDNDGDGFVDAPADPGCRDAAGLLENPKCQNGLNDDTDGFVDFDGGQSIHGACTGGTCPPGVSDPNADGVADPDPQCVGAPHRDNEKPNRNCGLGFELAFLLPGLVALRAWRREWRLSAEEGALR
jgi:hypothetical protein